jgi:bacteriorhodopsin
VLLQGAAQGLSTALILFLVMWLFIPSANILALLVAALLFSILVSMAFAAVGYLLSRGERDFTSVQQTVATRYEVLCEHKVAEQAQEMIAGMSPANL